jgi:hypothetical protein
MVFSDSSAIEKAKQMLAGPERHRLQIARAWAIFPKCFPGVFGLTDAVSSAGVARRPDRGW